MNFTQNLRPRVWRQVTIPPVFVVCGFDCKIVVSGIDDLAFSTFFSFSFRFLFPALSGMRFLCVFLSRLRCRKKSADDTRLFLIRKGRKTMRAYAGTGCAIKITRLPGTRIHCSDTHLRLQRYRKSTPLLLCPFQKCEKRASLFISLCLFRCRGLKGKMKAISCLFLHKKRVPRKKASLIFLVLLCDNAAQSPKM